MLGLGGQGGGGDHQLGGIDKDFIHDVVNYKYVVKGRRRHGSVAISLIHTRVSVRGSRDIN